MSDRMKVRSRNNIAQKLPSAPEVSTTKKADPRALTDKVVALKLIGKGPVTGRAQASLDPNETRVEADSITAEFLHSSSAMRTEFTAVIDRNKHPEVVKHLLDNRYELELQPKSGDNVFYRLDPRDRSKLVVTFDGVELDKLRTEGTQLRYTQDGQQKSLRIVSPNVQFVDLQYEATMRRMAARMR